MHTKLIVSMGSVGATLCAGLFWILDFVRRLLFEMQRRVSATGSASVLRWKAEETLTELLLTEGAVIMCICCPYVYLLYFMCICCTMCVLLLLLQMPDCWLEVSIRKVLRPATSTQVFLGFPLSTSEC